MTTLGLRKALDITFDDALGRVPEALKSEGFGILTEIDIQATLGQKLGVDFRRYRILGACNPAFAHEALQTEVEAGLLLPCNVVVYEDDGGHAVVLMIDPTKTAGASGNERLVALAEKVKAKLARALEALVAQPA